ncbi:MAG: membrane protein insertase YidC [Lentisphaeria bacterium]|nr:membrane protein insertase YidC [Lentisphaeria bacterium]
MNFKFDKDTVLIVLVGCLLMGGWLIYMPKYQAKRAAEYQKMLETTQQSAPAQQANANPGASSASAQTVVADPGAGQTPSETAAGTVSALTETKTVSLENKLFRVTIDGLTGSLSSAKLLDPRYKLKDSGEAIELFRDGAYRTFELKTNPGLVPVSLDVKENGPLSAEVVRTFANGLKLTQTFTLPEDNYMVVCDYAWTNPASAAVTVDGLGVRLAGLPQVKDLTGDKVYSERLNVDFCKVGSGMCDSADPQVKSQEKFDKKTTCDSPVAWIGSSNKYFASLLFAADAKPFASTFGERIWKFPAGSSNEKDLYAVPSMTGDFGTVTFAPGADTVKFSLKTYCGPKEMARIRALGSSVMGVMHISYYSWFEFIARPMVMLLNWLKSLCGSYGIAIILLTLIVRILFWPVTQKANSSMRRMQKLQPKIKALQEQYKETPMDTPDDTSRKKAELNQKMMELYRTEKVNPVGGCLPILLQIPVFIALYSALDSAVELRNVPFLWCTDLSRPDLVGPTLPFALPFIGQVGFHPLVIAMTALMIVQQKMTPTTGDSAQQKMMMLMPVIMLFMFYNLPSGLTLYWTVSQIFSILQMKYGQIAAKRDEARQNSTPQKA